MKDKVLTDDDLDRLLTEYMPKANILLDQLEEERDKDMGPHFFSKHYQKNMKKIIKEHNRRPARRKNLKVSKYIAASLIVFALINSILIVSVEAYRETVIKKVVKSYRAVIQTTWKTENRNGSTIYVMERKVEEPVIIELDFIEPSYIPEGFESISDTQNDIKRKIEYMHGDKSIVYTQSILGNQEIIVYRNDLSTKKKKISDKTIYYTEDKGIYKVSWNENEFNYSIIADVSFEELINIIEGIQK